MKDGKYKIGQNLNVTNNKRDKVRNTSSDNAQEKTEVSQLRSIRHDLLIAFKKKKKTKKHTHFSKASLRGLACSLQVFLNGTTIIREIAFFIHRQVSPSVTLTKFERNHSTW